MNFGLLGFPSGPAAAEPEQRLGVGQRHFAYSAAERAFGTWYYNGTGRPIEVAAYSNSTVSAALTGEVSLDLVTIVGTAWGYPVMGHSHDGIGFTVPANTWYRILSAGNTMTAWTELRTSK